MKSVERPVSAQDVRRTFLHPPPPQLRRSPLFQCLPEAAYLSSISADGNGSRQQQQQQQQQQHSAGGAAAFRNNTTQGSSSSTSASGLLPPRRAASATLRRVLPNDGELSVTQLPSRMAQGRVAFPATAAQPHDSSSSGMGRGGSGGIVRPSSATHTLSAGHHHSSPSHSSSNATPIWCATSFMVAQAAEVAEYEAAHAVQMRAKEMERERKWALMRARELELIHRSQSETVKKRKMREAKVAAVEQQHEFHEREREMLSYVERQARSSFELQDRRARSSYFLDFGERVVELNLAAATNAITYRELSARIAIALEMVVDIEARVRVFFLRIATQERTVLFAHEKGQRVILLKRLQLFQAWRSQQDAQVHSFANTERKLRYKIHDDEGMGFSVFEAEKQGMLVELAREVRRKHEAFLAAVREVENQHAHQRRAMDEEDGVRRGELRNDEGIQRPALRDKMLVDRKDAHEACLLRKKKEQEARDAENIRQMQPIFKEEVRTRRRVAGEEISLWFVIASLASQRWAELLIPVNIGVAGETPGVRVRSELVAPYGCEQIMLTPNIVFKRKVDARHFSSGPLTNCVLSVSVQEGLAFNDEIDVNYASVTTLREKGPAAFLTTSLTKALSKEPSPVDVHAMVALQLCTPLLRTMDNAAMLDEDGNAFVSVQSVGEVPAVESCKSLAKFNITKTQLEEGLLTEGGVLLLTASFNPMDKTDSLRLVEKLMQGLVLRTNGVSRRKRVFHLEFSFSGVKPQKAPSSPASGLKALSQKASFARPRAKSIDSGALTNYKVSLSLVVHTAPEQLCRLNSAGRGSGTNGFTRHAVVYDYRTRLELVGPKQPVYSCALFTGINFHAAKVLDFSGSLLRLRFRESVSPDDSFIFVPEGTPLVLKKDEIKHGASCVAKLVFGKILPSATTSTKELLLFVPPVEGGGSPCSAHLLEQLVASLHFANVANPQQTVISPARRIVELTLMLPKRLQYAQSNIVADVLVAGVPTSTLHWRNSDPEGRLVIFCDNALPTPESLRPVITSDEIPLFGSLLLDVLLPATGKDAAAKGGSGAAVAAASAGAQPNAAVVDHVFAGGVLTVAVIDNGFAWDSLHIKSDAMVNPYGTLRMSGLNVLWSPVPAAAFDEPSLVHVATLKQKSSMPTILDGKSRPGIAVEFLPNECRVLAVLAILRSIVFSTTVPYDFSGVAKCIAVDLSVALHAGKKATAASAKDSAICNSARTLVYVKCIHPAIIPLKKTNDPIPIFHSDTNAPTAVGPIIQSLPGNGGEALYDGGAIHIEVVDRAMLQKAAAGSSGAFPPAAGGDSRVNATPPGSPSLDSNASTFGNPLCPDTSLAAASTSAVQWQIRLYRESFDPFAEQSNLGHLSEDNQKQLTATHNKYLNVELDNKVMLEKAQGGQRVCVVEDASLQWDTPLRIDLVPRSRMWPFDGVVTPAVLADILSLLSIGLQRRKKGSTGGSSADADAAAKATSSADKQDGAGEEEGEDEEVEASENIELALRITVVDGSGLKLQIALECLWIPQFMPSYLDPQTLPELSFRPSNPLVFAGKLPLMPSAVIKDEDTTHCGAGYMTFTPLQGVTAADRLCWVTHLPRTSALLPSNSSKKLLAAQPAMPTMVSLAFRKSFAMDASAQSFDVKSCSSAAAADDDADVVDADEPVPLELLEEPSARQVSPRHKRGSAFRDSDDDDDDDDEGNDSDDSTPAATSADANGATSPKPLAAAAAAPEKFRIARAGVVIATVQFLPSPTPGGGNSAAISIVKGTPLEYCTQMMHHIGIEGCGTATSLRKEYLFKFNAMDEAVPDTRAVIAINCGPKLLQTAPIYETRVMKASVSRNVAVFPKLSISTGSCDLGHELTISLDTSVRGDALIAVFDDIFQLDGDNILIPVPEAATFAGGQRSGGMLPSPGLPAVLFGRLVKNTTTLLQIELAGASAVVQSLAILDPVNSATELASSAVIAFLERIYYRNEEMEVSRLAARHAAIRWAISDQEVALFTVPILVESSEELPLELSCAEDQVHGFGGETIRVLAKVKSNSSTGLVDLLTQESIARFEVRNATAHDKLTLTAIDDPRCQLGPDERSVFWNSDLVAQIEKSTTSSITLSFNSLPLSVLPHILGLITYRGPSGRAVLVQTTVTPFEGAEPATLNIQANVHGRVMGRSRNMVQSFIKAFSVKKRRASSSFSCRQLSQDAIPRKEVPAWSPPVAIGGDFSVLTQTVTGCKISFTLLGPNDDDPMLAAGGGGGASAGPPSPPAQPRHSIAAGSLGSDKNAAAAAAAAAASAVSGTFIGLAPTYVPLGKIVFFALPPHLSLGVQRTTIHGPKGGVICGIHFDAKQLGWITLTFAKHGRPVQASLVEDLLRCVAFEPYKDVASAAAAVGGSAQDPFLTVPATPLGGEDGGGGTLTSAPSMANIAKALTGSKRQSVAGVGGGRFGSGKAAERLATVRVRTELQLRDGWIASDDWIKLNVPL